MKPCSRHYLLVLLIVLGLWPLTVFARPPIKVHVSILPQKYFVERIGGDKVIVDVLVKPGKSPATYSPSPDQMKRLASSDVYFRIGVPFENGFLHKIKSMAGALVVDTRKGIIPRQMKGYPHDVKNQQRLLGTDPHIWMNPLLVKIQARTIFKTLSSIDPDNKNVYQKNYKLFIKDLDRLDHHLASLLKDLKGENLLVFHPSFGYFTDAYGLKQIAVETMGKAPKGKAISNIIKLAKKQKIRIIFAQPQFDRNSAEKIASAINGVVVLIDPLAYDYLANMENIAQSIALGLKK